MVKMRKVTDLSIPYDALQHDKIIDLFAKSKDHSQLKQVVGTVLDDIACIYDPYGHTKKTLRDLALHVLQREEYLRIRTKSNDPRVHRVLDRLMSYNYPQAGEFTVSLIRRENGMPYFEVIGCYDFEMALVELSHLEPILRCAGYSTVSSY